MTNNTSTSNATHGDESSPATLIDEKDEEEEGMEFEDPEIHLNVFSSIRLVELG